MIYPVIVGIYLGDCVTTAIVCSIGARAEARRVGIVNILFNLSETVLVLVGVTLVHHMGFLGSLWNRQVDAGMIANTNTIFNLGCALLLFPMLTVYERASRRIVRDDEEDTGGRYKEKLEALSPIFFQTPALALRSCYDVLLTMFRASRKNIEMGSGLLRKYDDKTHAKILKEEDNIDMLTDRVSRYMIEMLPTLSDPQHVAILDEYYKVVAYFERLGDHWINIAKTAESMMENNTGFSERGLYEVSVLEALVRELLDNAELAFEKRDLDAAFRIEPLQEVAGDLINAIRGNHLKRVSTGECDILMDSLFEGLMTDYKRVADLCSNVGAATIIRVNPEIAEQEHDYYAELHSGRNENFNKAYNKAYEKYFRMLKADLPKETAPAEPVPAV